MNEIIVFLSDVAVWKRLGEGLISDAILLLLLPFLVFISPKSWGLALWKWLKRKYRWREPLRGRGVFPYIKKMATLLPVGKWMVWSTDAREFEIDPLYPNSFGATAFIPAKSVHPRNLQGYFRLTAHCYSEVPKKLWFVFSTQSQIKLVKDQVFMKFDGEDTRAFDVNVSSITPSYWYLDEPDSKSVEKSLLKSSRMLVRFTYYTDNGVETVTAEFDILGAKEALAKIKKRCQEHLHKQSRIRKFLCGDGDGNTVYVKNALKESTDYQGKIVKAREELEALLKSNPAENRDDFTGLMILASDRAGVDCNDLYAHILALGRGEPSDNNHSPTSGVKQ